MTEPSRRAWLVWGVALVAYAVAVLHRGSFGVAGPAAVERFDVTATVLSTFVVVQLGVYAAMQIPVGVLLDRFGSRTLIASGALLMAVGQLLLGLTDALAPAYVARVLIGAGDAATFISVIRLVALWFPARRVPLLTQVTGQVGQVGQLAAAVPLVAVLQRSGWSTAFVGLAAVGVLAAALAALVVRDSPAPVRPHEALRLLDPLRGAAREPGTWLGFSTHAVTQFSMTVFLMLWGFPFLLAQGLDEGAAGLVLAMVVVSAMVSAPVVGVLTARHPLRRSWMVLTTTGLTAAVWTAVLALPGPSPLWLLVLLALVLGLGGPTSLVGFDYARTSNGPARLGVATGLVNAGGFVTAVVTLLAVGIVLDTVPGPALSLGAFRVAFAAQAVPWALGVVAVLATRRRARERAAAQGVVVPSVRDVLARRRGERAVEGLAVEGPAVEGPAVEGPAVKGPGDAGR